MLLRQGCRRYYCSDGIRRDDDGDGGGGGRRVKHESSSIQVQIWVLVEAETDTREGTTRQRDQVRTGKPRGQKTQLIQRKVPMSLNFVEGSDTTRRETRKPQPNCI